MENFHSTLSRRDFMKALGLSGAGIGMASATSSVFHDLDEVMASPNAGFQRPWWVKEREFENPTCEVNWDIIKPMDSSKSLHGYITTGPKGWGTDPASSFNQVFGTEKIVEIHETTNKSIIDGVQHNEPGWNLRDRALDRASTASYVKTVFTLDENKNEYSPEFFGVSKWQGTPEENSRMLRAAARFLGASQVQYGVLNEKTKNLIFNRFYTGQPIVFENTEKAYYTSNKFVLPSNKELYFISLAIQMHKEGFRHGRSSIRNSSNHSRYRLWSQIQGCMQVFLEAIGYQGIGYPMPYWGVMPSAADAILSGHAEIARNKNVCISPEYGTVCGYFTLLTDLPLEPSRPVDAGIFRFCHTCRKCADACPVQCISHGAEPSWEVPPPTTNPNMEPVYSMPGKKVFHTDSSLCMTQFNGFGIGCGNCMGTCVFNTNNAAIVHEFVKGTVSTTGLLNGFLWQADKFFGYGLTPDDEKENWWNYSFPTYGVDSTVSVSNGGY